MLSNIANEIIRYTIMPIIIIFIIDLVLLVISKRKKESSIKFIILVSLIIVIAIMLSFIMGFICWCIRLFWIKEIFFNNITGIMMMIFLSLVLLALIIWIHLKLFRLIEMEKE